MTASARQCSTCYGRDGTIQIPTLFITKVAHFATLLREETSSSLSSLLYMLCKRSARDNSSGTTFPPSCVTSNLYQFERNYPISELNYKASAEYKYLLLAEFSVRARAINRWKKKRGSVIYSTDRKNEANKMFIIWLLPVWGPETSAGRTI